MHLGRFELRFFSFYLSHFTIVPRLPMDYETHKGNKMPNVYITNITCRRVSFLLCIYPNFYENTAYEQLQNSTASHFSCLY
jgi:hypothetical protein